MPPENAATPPRPPISADEANILLRADFTNLAKKVREGKTLSVAERRIISNLSSGSEAATQHFVSNIVDLAEALGCNRKTIQRKLKVDGHPATRPDGRYDVSAWREFLRGQGSRVVEPEADIVALNAKNLLLRNEKLEFQLNVLRKAYVPVDLVEQWGNELGGAVRKVVSAMHLIAPNLSGLEVSEISALLKEQERETLAHLSQISERIEEWRSNIEPDLNPTLENPAG